MKEIIEKAIAKGLSDIESIAGFLLIELECKRKIDVIESGRQIELIENAAREIKNYVITGGVEQNIFRAVYYLMKL